MNHKLLGIMLLALVPGCMTTSRCAQYQGPRHLPCCEPGFQIVEETCYRDEICKVCRVVPAVHKKTNAVFECKEIDYCQKGCPGFLVETCGDCCDCTNCGCPRTKKVLLKKFVTEETPTCTCVVEYVTKRVPYTVFRKVPCGGTCPPPPCEPTEYYAPEQPMPE